jgi:hypothetical protein
MKYFSNIFICCYRIYKKLEKRSDPRFTSVIVISMCFTALLFMGCVIMQKIYKIYNNPLYFLAKYPFLLIGLWIGEIIVLYNYYSETKIISLNENFDKKKMIEKWVWVLITIITLVVPIVVGALILNS